MITALHSGPEGEFEHWQPHLVAAFTEAEIDARATDSADPEDVHYIIFSPKGPVQDFRPYTNLRAVLSTWAGVETFLDNPTLTAPLTRMVDHGLTQSMVEWVLGHVMRYHLGMDAHLFGQDGHWRSGIVPPLAEDRSVGILGIGALGQACAAALAPLGFDLHGWSRSPKDLPGMICHAGEDGLTEILGTCEIIVTLLPLTPETENILNARRISQMRAKAYLINPGRGPLIEDEALLKALDEGHLSHATLDVFRTEPLPPAHPFWTHPKVTVTPHIAADTRAKTGARSIAENIRRFEAGEPLLNQVDRNRGY
jgi:glyoxylate/hydroxypyruvate reductase A